MTRYILLFALLFMGCATGKIVPLGKKGVEKYLRDVRNANPDSLGFDPKIATIKDENSEGSSMLISGRNHIWIYDIDVNNDGKNEYLAIYVYGGSLNTSGILSVITEEGTLLNHSIIISKSLWNDDSGDISKFHLWLAIPAVVKRDGKYILRFLDKKPKTLFTEYMWIKNSFKKICERTSNTY